MERILIQGLSIDFTEAELRLLFERYGHVGWLKLVSHPQTGHCLGWGFVDMDALDAHQAVTDLNGIEFQGRRLHVQQATTHAEKLPCRYCQYIDFCDNTQQSGLIDSCAFFAEKGRISNAE
jgi:RNA recognition motif-containing protein